MTESFVRATGQARVEQRRPLCLETHTTALACLCTPKSEAVALLSKVLARLRGLDVPVVQFIQVSTDLRVSSVPRDFAEASLSRLGRTLLASLHSPDPRQLGAASGRLPVAIVGRRRARRTLKEVPDVVPDVALQGLYHVRIGGGVDELNQITQVPPAIWLGEARLDFRLLVVDCGPLELNPAAVELASRCHGSILTIAAGVTDLARVRSVAQQVQLAGGKLLGSVLYDAPTRSQSAEQNRTRPSSRPQWLA